MLSTSTVQALASPTPTPLPAPTLTASPTPSFSPPPTVDAATRALQQQQRALAAESARLASAALTATAALEGFQQSRRDAADADRAVGVAHARSRSAAGATAAARRTLAGYVGALYRFGSVDPRLVIVTSALSATEPQQFFRGLGLASQVGDHRAQLLEGLVGAEAAQVVAAETARSAAAAQRVTSRRAAAANRAAAAAVAAYRQQVVSRTELVARTAGVLQVARQRDQAVHAAEALARAQGWIPAPACAGGDLTGADNGELPVAALCPLLFTVSRKLRADAAYAFNTLATEYAAAFGVPLCVTDAYRTLTGQIAVAAEKPLLAAHPGRSNHGWAIAVDLCGGVESFTSTQHRWMLDNALLFGWFHPAWAEPTGSRPEPWHWEFAG
jgi:hypothetical protein